MSVEDAVDQLERSARRVPRVHERVETSGSRSSTAARTATTACIEAGGTLGSAMKIEDILAAGPGASPTLDGAQQDRRPRRAGARGRRAQHPEIDRERLVQALEDRERLNSTALGDGVAIPHGKLPGVKRVVRGLRAQPRRASTSTRSTASRRISSSCWSRPRTRPART